MLELVVDCFYSYTRVPIVKVEFIHIMSNEEMIWHWMDVKQSARIRVLRTVIFIL